MLNQRKLKHPSKYTRYTVVYFQISNNCIVLCTLRLPYLEAYATYCCKDSTKLRIYKSYMIVSIYLLTQQSLWIRGRKEGIRIKISRFSCTIIYVLARSEVMATNVTGEGS